MARTQAPDFERRRAAILDHAARLYAEKGYLGASKTELASVCAISPSLLYHYYRAKEDILFDVMNTHVQALLDVALDVSAQTVKPSDKLRMLNRQFMHFSCAATHRHHVLLHELGQLSPDRRKAITDVQSRITAVIESILLQLLPASAGPHPARHPATMLFSGMISWMPAWFVAEGAFRSEEVVADLTTDIFLEGLRGATQSQVPSAA